MLTEILVFLLTTLLAYFIYTFKKNHWYFERKGVKYLPGVPLFGNNMKSMFLKKHVIDDIGSVYSSFPDERYIGYIEGTMPILMIRDPEIIKAITVKDFEYFADHRVFFSDPLFEESLVQLKGDKWRDMRTTLSPAFTGSKMKQMVPFMNEISNNIVEYLRENSNTDIEVDDLVRRYTNDVIASTAFGLQVNSLKDKDNEFYKTGQALMVFSTLQRIKMVITAMAPSLGKLTTIFPIEVTTFFREIVKSTMDYREKNKIERPDMIQLLMEASKGTLKSSPSAADKNVGFAATEEVNLKQSKEVRHWTQDDLAAQAFIFFFAGFESTASVLVLAIHQMALQPEVQDKLYSELKAFHEKHEGFSYEQVHELKYLDAVINETLRKWSPALVMDRVCLKDYTLPPPHEGGKPYHLKKGDIVYNMVNALHMDPRYFPDPERFNPDRFSDEQKDNIQPFTFMPFGSGPRNCIASRFALLELKVFLYHLILNFSLEKCEKTPDPIQLRPADFNIRALGGSWVRTVPRK